jgi:hypothetical protein
LICEVVDYERGSIIILENGMFGYCILVFFILLERLRKTTTNSVWKVVSKIPTARPPNNKENADTTGHF